MLSELISRLFTESKLSGLLLGSCVFGGLGLGLRLRMQINALVQKGQFHVGTVKTTDVDANVAFVLCVPTGSGHGPEPDTELLMVSMEYKAAIDPEQIDKLIVVGNKVPDQYGRQWIIPCTDTWSGIYTIWHPILRWFVEK